jgi:thiol-disulfide isomerase/thioredoxin
MIVSLLQLSFTFKHSMKRTLFTLLAVLGLSRFVSAADGYHINIKVTNTTDSFLYLAHYFGKPLPTIYMIDSARIDKNGNATLKSTEPAVGGIYIIMMADRKNYTELLLTNGDNMSLTGDAKNLNATVKFKNSPENERFAEYVSFLKGYAERQQGYVSALAGAKTKSDSTAILQKANDDTKAVGVYRQNYVSKYPNTLLSNIFTAMEVPQIPEGKHYLPDGKEDSTFGFYYYKNHYWDKFNFKDDRLMHTPVYDAKLEEYIGKLTKQTPDSIEKEADMLLAKTRGSNELFKYTLHWLTKYAQESKVMGLDEVFVYLVENYHMKGDASWMSSESLTKYIDHARKIAPTAIGNIGPDIKMVDINNKPVSLYDVKSKYTMLIFWSPECGTCRREMPQLDSVYNAALKARGVKIFAVRTEGDVEHWKKTVNELKLDKWTNVYDPEHKSPYRSQYNVYATPVVYILDEKHIIRAKRIDHTNAVTALDFIENEQAK